MGAQISRGFGNLGAKIIISLFFLDEAWKPAGATCVCRVTFSMSPDLFTLRVCVYSTKHCSVSVDSAVLILLFAKPVCAGVLKLLGHQALIWASRVVVGHLVLKAEYFILLLFPWRDQRFMLLCQLCLGRVGSQASGHPVHVARSPLPGLAVSPAVTKVPFWSRAVLLGKAVPACSKWARRTANK